MAIFSNEDVADRIRGIAAERRVQHSHLADALHVSRMSLSRRMNGKTPFTAEELSVVADRMGVPVGAFFGEAATATIGVAS